ncbi:cysteine ABC transporter ATP-binding protein, partial [Staphylococcus schleiferi]|nr:cysteine ABC transporter ATP-binding protein [Staphylococcus schleiferi]
PYIFNATIAENVSVFNTVPREKMMTVLQAVNLWDKVNALHDGIDTLIGEGGEMMSGGEMRRIELARLLLMQPDFVVLDEPVAGLDRATEQLIQQTLDTYFTETTRLTIAHRQQTIAHANRRIYLQDGKIRSDDTQIQIDFKADPQDGDV